MKPRLAGFLAMVGGGGVVIAVTVVMHARTADVREQSAADAVSMAVAPPPPRPPPARPRPSPRRPPAPASAPPPPALSASLGGLSFGLPTLTADVAALTGDAADVVMTDEAVDTPPRPIEQPPPEYPARARAHDVEGAVTVSLLIGEDGAVRDARVVASEPAGTFDAATLDAVRRWRFAPATYEGRPVAVRRQQTLRFALR